MWNNRTVSVILPTYREKGSIRKCIEDFFNTGVVDEIIVVNNNADPGTDEEVSMTSAKIVYENKQGYGYAIQAGLRQAKGDFLVISEPDGTFLGKDTFKLLAYADDFDVVFGTRTTKELIWKGANMVFSLRWGNFFVARLIEFLFNTSHITDVGCTMKLLNRRVYNRLSYDFKVGDSRFNAEFILLVIIKKIKFIEIPVNYNKRVGVSSVTGDRKKAFVLGLSMIVLIIRYFFNRVFLKMK